MRVEYKGNDLNEKEKAFVWDILCQCDDEFYPKLSARNSSSQKNLKDAEAVENHEKPIVYYEEMIKQDFLLAYEQEEVVGFLFECKVNIYEMF